MRSSCLYCASKHIAQAIVLLLEAPQGYPLHRWLAIGHLAEAGDETVLHYPGISQQIRGVRLKLMDQEDGFEPSSMMDLLSEVRRVAVKDGARSDAEFLQEHGM